MSGRIGVEGGRDEGKYAIGPDLYEAFGIDLDPLLDGQASLVNGRSWCSLCSKDFRKKSDLKRHFADCHWTTPEGEPLPGHNCPETDCPRYNKPFSRFSRFKSHLKSQHGYTPQRIDILFPSASQSQRSVANPVTPSVTGPGHAPDNFLWNDAAELDVGLDLAWPFPNPAEPGGSVRKRKRGDPNSGLRSTSPRSTASDARHPNMTNVPTNFNQPAVANTPSDAVSSRTRSHNVADSDSDKERDRCEEELGDLHRQKREVKQEWAKLKDELAQHDSNVQDLFNKLASASNRDKELAMRIAERREASLRLNQRRRGRRAHVSPHSASSIPQEDVVGG